MIRPGSTTLPPVWVDRWRPNSGAIGKRFTSGATSRDAARCAANSSQPQRGGTTTTSSGARVEDRTAPRIECCCIPTVTDKSIAKEYW
jgi:hypothetical protein